MKQERVLFYLQRLKPQFIFVGANEAKIIVLGNFRVDSTLDFLINDKAFLQFIADGLFTLRAIVQSLFDDAGPHRATLVNQRRVLGHAAVADDPFRRQAKPEIFMPPVAQFLPVGRILFHIRLVSQAEVAAIAAAGEDGFHFIDP